MGIVLDCLEGSIAIARRTVTEAENRWRAYIAQCATILGVNDGRFMFDPDARAFKDNPNYQEKENSK